MTTDLRDLLAAVIATKTGHEVGRHRYAREQLHRVSTLAAALRPSFDTLALTTSDDPDGITVGDVLNERWPVTDPDNDEPDGAA